MPWSFCHNLYILLAVVAFNCLYVQGLNNLTYVSPSGILCHLCPAGYFFKDHCRKENTIALCEPCPEGTYSSLPNRAIHCELCSRHCESRTLEVISPCTSTSNLTCDCPKGTIRNNHDKHHAICRPFKKCGPGLGVIRHGTPEKEPVCEECTPGETFSDESSSTDPCSPCTLCGSNEFVLDCNVTHDRICAKEDKGLSIPIVITISVVVALVLVMCTFIAVYFIMKKRNSNTTVEKSYDTDTRSQSECFAMDIFDNECSASDPMLPPHISMEETQLVQNTERRRIWQDSYTQIFSYISYHLITGWKLFMRDLYARSNVTDCDSILQRQEHDNRDSVSERIYNCLLKWKQGGNIQSAECLREALQSAGQSEILRYLEDKFPQVMQVTESENTEN